MKRSLVYLNIFFLIMNSFGYPLICPSSCSEFPIKKIHYGRKILGGTKIHYENIRNIHLILIIFILDFTLKSLNEAKTIIFRIWKFPLYFITQ